ncbi:hypothetical protein Pmar_PMAR003646 [Perkinsus marinus ATCC 50983]|uniref:Uncharacterized protein n=1 Tax=Perkinsus marinus (strain ATCC 50983 / TXsc) TaxID=423536 RepID=C5KHX1_PERM5|nr:hypothetical protein Pmar_PMAR003646 [Perkinsus marinus ATCC 50983]EER16183.1 hypothetical protein Pmar_PMAR003646 [Perkinsus marinus ATCC 50983]|eukprot:XP_002784387.1 hypothetical protein Pmar_PMAR003646 [Perkinsus marinus ATCC 50983]
MVNEDTSQHVVRVAPEAWSPHLPGMRLRQVEVRGEAICSLLMKLPDDASTAEVVMAICSSCTSPTELNQDPGDWCIHVEAAVKILEQERARNSQGETTCVAVSSSTVVDPRPTDRYYREEVGVHESN